MKIVIIGGVAGGASAAARIRRLDEQAEIVMFEKGEHTSFSNCALPYYLGGDVRNSSSLIMMTPEAFRKRFNIQVRTCHEVLRILRDEKCVLAKDLAAGQEYKESYDRLVIATGAEPVRPSDIAGVNGPNVFTVRNVTDTVRLKQAVDSAAVSDVAVYGAGFIGLEIAENLVKAGKKVSLLVHSGQVMSTFDEDMAQILHKEAIDHGIRLFLNTTVSEIGDGFVRAKQGARKSFGEGQPFSSDGSLNIPAQAVVLAVGMKPDSALAREAGLELGDNGAVKVNYNYQTSDPDIYAVGSAAESYGRLLHKAGKPALAGPAQRQARAAADHICGQYHTNTGSIGSSCLQFFTQNAACTGMNEKAARAAGIPYDVAYVLPPDKVSIMPGSNYMAFKLLFEKPTGRILGAQAVGKGDVTKRIDVIAAMITMNATLEQLKELELCYSPVFGTAKDIVNMAALVGLNLLHDRIRQVRVSDVRSLVENGAYVIDVREENEFAKGHIKGAHNIPLSQFRNRMDEVPRDVPVYLHCRTSQRSYYAICELLANGYRNAYNVSGSFLGLCLYEYFTDVTTGREPVVTAYNFD